MGITEHELGFLKSDVITVGVASYNRPTLLQRAIQSAVSQSYKELEILISDNGSTDPLVREIIEEFARSDSRIRCIYHPVNQGAFFNFRTVLNAANGKYFIWLADDDYWCSEYLENILKQAKKTGAALTYGRIEVVDLEFSEEDCVGKEMPTTRQRFAAICNFVRFDSDSVFYGLFQTSQGRKLMGALRNWWLPKSVALNNPFLEYNFVSYVFVFGLLSSGGFCNASSEKTRHFAGGRKPFSNSPSLGWRHLILFFSYIFIHLQMAIRFAHAAFATGSLSGIIVSPFAALYLFFRRIKMIVTQRLNRFVKV